MLNIEQFITKIRNIIADGTSFALTDVFSPALPQEKEDICCVTLLGGNTNNNLCENMYNDLTFRVLIRGTANDTTTRALADEVFNALHMQNSISLTNGNIINIFASGTPVFVGKDENERILYNITFNSKVEGE